MAEIQGALIALQRIRDMSLELNLRFNGRDSVSVHLDGGDSGDVTFTDPLTAKDHEQIRWYVETYGAHSLGDPDDAEAARISALLPVLGQRLFDAVFSEKSAWRLFERFLSDESDTRLLTITAEHAAVLALPWELLNHTGHESGFLFWENPRISIRRRIAGAQHGRLVFKVEPKDTVHLLFVVSRPTGSGFLDPRADPGAVLDALDKYAPGRITVEFLRPSTLDALMRRLEDRDAKPVDILHFDGHGVLDERGGMPTRYREERSNRRGGFGSERSRSPAEAEGTLPLGEPANTGYLLFENDDAECDFVSADKLGRNLNRHKVSLVILSACESAKIMTGAEADLADDEAHRPMGSVAARLTATGIPAVLAMTHSVLVATTRQLFGRLYEELARHKPVGEALDNARRHLFDHPEKYEVQHGATRKTFQLHDWFLPALYEPGNDAPLLRQPAPDATVFEPATQLSNLPHRPEAGFFGRRGELFQIERWLAGATRRVTVSGFGGQGKTALALEAGRWMLRTGLFRAAVFVDYARMQSLDALGIAVGEIGGVLGESYIDADDVTAALAKTPTLVILDNLESLAEEPLRTLLTAAKAWSTAGASRVLCTTRRPDFGHEDYRNEGTHLHRRIALHGLGDRAHPDDALEWFAVLSKLPPAPAQPQPPRAALIELFDRVRFHPLSIRVLAQQLKSRSPTELGERLGQLLADSTVQAAAREINDTPAGLFASLQLSLEHLDAQAHAVLPRLGVFHGGAFEDDLLAITGLNAADERARLTARLEAAESGDARTILEALGRDVDGEVTPDVAGQLRDALPALTASWRESLAALPARAENLWPELRRQLEAAALVEAEPVDGVGVPFLRFHPTLAPLLWQQLRDEERTRLEAAHRKRYAALARYLYQADTKAPHAARAIARRELPNLLHAVHAALDAGEPEAVDFADSVNRFLSAFGLRKEAAALLAKTQTATVETGSREWFLAQSGRGEQLRADGRIGEAVGIFEEILQRLGSTPSYDRAVTLFRLGRCFESAGRPDLGANFQRAALGVLDALEPSESVTRLRGGCFTDLADNLRESGLYDEARENYAAGLKIAEELGNLRSQGVTLGQLGTLAMHEGRLSEAMERYRAALALFQRLDEPAMEAVGWHQLGMVYQKARQWEDAERHYRESARIEERLGNLTGAAQTWNQLAVVAKLAGNHDAAERWYKKVIEAFPPDQEVQTRAGSLHNLANLLRAQPGRSAEARAAAEAALALKKTIDAGVAEIWTTYEILAQLAIQSATNAPEGQRATLLAEAREHRRLARDARRDFPGTPTQLRRFAPHVVLTVYACAGDAAARLQLGELQAHLRQPGSDFAALAAALDRVLAGERDVAAICVDLDCDDSMVMEFIFGAFANPDALRYWVAQQAESN